MYRVYTKNGAVSKGLTIETPPFFCVLPVYEYVGLLIVASN
jgi:hypothetical protein